MNLNYNWSFGSSACFCLVIQILSGAFSAKKKIVLNPRDFLNQEVCFFDLIPWVQSILT